MFSRRLRVIRAKRAARSPISSPDPAGTGWSSRPEPDHRHRVGQLADGPGEPRADGPGGEQPGRQGERDDRDQRAALAGQDLLQQGVGAAHARLAGPAIDLPVHGGESRLEPTLELALGEREGLGPMARIGQGEDAVRHPHDVVLNPADAVGQAPLARSELRAPAILPVADDLAGQGELLAGGRVEAAEIAPDDLSLVEHRGLQLGVGPGARHALAQRLEGAALQDVAADRLRPDQEGGQHHQREAEQEFALEGHASNIPRKRQVTGAGRSPPARDRW